jgi:hypothetical protein
VAVVVELLPLRFQVLAVQAVAVQVTHLILMVEAMELSTQAAVVVVLVILQVMALAAQAVQVLSL